MCKGFFGKLFGFGDCLQGVLLLLFRLFWGISFFLGGYSKIMNMDPIIDMFTALGIPFPVHSVYLVAWVECIGGLMLAFGFLARLAAVPLAIIMIVALFTAHLDATLGMFQDAQTFINQMPFNYLLTCLIVYAFGPGKYSIDALFGKPFCCSRCE